jgi:HK97 family phage prohead protease
MVMNCKEFRVAYKGGENGAGTIEGYASTWIREPDSYGDVVKQGAFTRTLAERWNGGEGIPLLWAHQMDELKSYIGTAKAEEDEKGLHFIATFDDTEEAQRVRDLYKDGRLSKFSFAYDVIDAGPVELADGTKANELRDLELFEISCVCVPANDDAGVVEVKAGRRNSKKDADALRQAVSLIQSVLGELEDDTDGEDSAEEPKDNAKAEDLKGADEEVKSRLLAYIKATEDDMK